MNISSDDDGLEIVVEDRESNTQDCTVAILTMYRPAHVVRAVRSVLPQLDPADDVLVIDQCAHNCTCANQIQRAVPQCQRAKIRIVRISTLTGAAQARNYALARIATPLVFFLDDDAEVLPGAVNELKRALRGHDMVAAGVVQDSHPSLAWYYWYRIFRRGAFRDQRQELNLGRRERTHFDAPLPGGGAMLKAAAAREVAFDETYISYSMGEDVEFTNRLLTIGRTCLLPGARIRHERTPDARDRSPRSEMRDAVASLHYIYLRHPEPGTLVSVAYGWAQLGLCVRALAASLTGRNVRPLLGWLDGWSSVRRRLTGLPFLRPQ